MSPMPYLGQVFISNQGAFFVYAGGGYYVNTYGIPTVLDPEESTLLKLQPLPAPYRLYEGPVQ